MNKSLPIPIKVLAGILILPSLLYIILTFVSLWGHFFNTPDPANEGLAAVIPFFLLITVVPFSLFQIFSAILLLRQRKSGWYLVFFSMLIILAIDLNNFSSSFFGVPALDIWTLINFVFLIIPIGSIFILFKYRKLYGI